MRIGLFLENPAKTAGGAFRFEDEIARAIPADGSHEFCTISSSPDSGFGFEHVDLRQSSPSKWERRSRRLYGLVRRNRLTSQRNSFFDRFDLLYSPSPIIPTTTDCPFVVTCWDLQHRVQPFFPEVSIVGWEWEARENHYRNTLPRAAAVVSGTEQGKHEIEHFYGVNPDRVEVIPFPPPLALTKVAAEQPDWAPNSDFFFYPAQFWPHKNHVTILKAVQLLRDKHGVRVSMVFTGADRPQEKGTLPYLRRLCAELEIEKQVSFPGFVTDNELRWLYENSIALVFMTLFGPDNLPPLEAFALGCPVIASDVPGSEGQLGTAALRVPPTCESALAEQMMQLATTPDLRDTLRLRGRDRCQSLDVANYVERLLELFDRFSKYRRCWE